MEFASIKHHLSVEEARSDWHALSCGDFEPLGETGIFSGLDFLSDWPNSLEEAALQLSSNSQGKGNRESNLGPFARYFDPRIRDMPVKRLISENGPTIFRDAGILCRATEGKVPFVPSKAQTVSQNEALEEFKFSRRMLQRLARDGTYLRGKSDSFRGLQLFDRSKLRELSEAIGEYSPAADLAAKLGCPKHVVQGLAENGKLEEHKDRQLGVALGEPAYRMPELSEAFRNCRRSPPKDGLSNLESLTSVLAHQLEPEAWAICIAAISKGEIGGFALSDSPTCVGKEVMVEREEVVRLCGTWSGSHSNELILSAAAAGRVVGAKDIVVSLAKKSGLISSLSVQDLVEFREQCVFPREMKLWFSHGPLGIKRIMMNQGARPVATLSTVNVWDRADLERVRPESAKVRFYREWCHSS